MPASRHIGSIEFFARRPGSPGNVARRGVPPASLTSPRHGMRTRDAGLLSELSPRSAYGPATRAADTGD